MSWLRYNLQRDVSLTIGTQACNCFSTSVVASFLTETTEAEIDLSEVLLDLDLTEDLLELFGV